MECPNCKAEVTGKFCRWCGSAVSMPANDANLASVCPTCGASVPPGTKFCSKCATPLARPAEPAAVQSNSECMYCGATLKPGVRFCNSCGKPVAPAASGRDAAPAWADAQAATVVENAAASVAPPAYAPASSQTQPFSATSPQAETQIGFEPAASAYETHPAPESLPQFEHQGIDPDLPANNSGFWANNKAILLTGVAVLGLAAGGLTYWFLLRKPAANGAPSSSSLSRPATAAPNKPSALETTTPSNTAGGSQSTAQPNNATATEPKKEDPGGVSIDVTTAVPSKPGDVPASAPGPSLSGKWHGEYTNHDANEIIKVTLRITEDNSPERLKGALTFDAEGSNSASCALTGVYNPHSKFMLLNIGSCQGNPPAYFFEGKIGFSSVEITARQVFGVDPAHNTLLSISRP